MKNYNDFIGNVTEYLERRFPEAAVSFETVRKNNGITKQGVRLFKEGDHLSSVLYLESFYQDYKEGKCLRDVLEDIGSYLESYQVITNVNMSFFKDFEKVKSNIVPKLINAELNQGLLEEVPHFKILDLAVVFCYYFDEKSELGRDGRPFKKVGMASLLIKNEHMLLWGKTLEDLTNLNNWLEQPFEPILLNMMEFVFGSIYGTPYPNLLTTNEPLKTLYVEGDEVAPAFYILSNKMRLWGATCILNKDLLMQIAKRMNTSLYIIPSSINEVIIVPVSPVSSENVSDLVEMVKEVNRCELAPTEVLSDSIYFFNKDIGELTICDKPIFDVIAM